MTGTPSPATPSAGAGRRCAALVQRLSPQERVGQLLMVAVASTGMTAEEAAAVERTRTGSVILLGNTTAGTRAVQDVVADVREAVVEPRQVEVLLAADQEGGQVQRLAGDGFSDIPSAAQQARSSAGELAQQAQTWGEELDRAGIDADLAPVADVVPRALAGVNEPIAGLQRGYGSDPDVVAEKVAAFTTGMGEAGIATAVKHFPGIGEVRGNTDTARRVVDTTTTRRDPGLAGFRAAVEAGADMVMVSSVIYDRIDGRRQAAFSPTVVDGMIRGDLGFDGVVISDDLAAAAVQDLAPGRRAVGFVQAGGDLAIVGDPAEAATMAGALADRAASDPAFASRVDESAARVLALKDRRGLADC
ncbi:glycoside hydrolase family 3 N-terminal domain-containing protein [Microlunatus lacustris]